MRRVNGNPASDTTVDPSAKVNVRVKSGDYTFSCEQAPAELQQA